MASADLRSVRGLRKMTEKGRIHIYCGDGKGKTTAAIGLIVRASGRGKRTLLVRFLKKEDSGELFVLDAISEVERMKMPDTKGFYWTLKDEEREELKKAYHDAWEVIQKKAVSGAYDLLVMDELMAAYGYGLVPREEVVRFLKEKPEHLEVVMTGRDPDEAILSQADYISEIRAVRHPFEKGVPAREGIEF